MQISQLYNDHFAITEAFNIEASFKSTKEYREYILKRIKNHIETYNLKNSEDEKIE